MIQVLVKKGVTTKLWNLERSESGQRDLGPKLQEESLGQRNTLAKESHVPCDRSKTEPCGKQR
jgi:hypothetical protein